MRRWRPALKASLQRFASRVVVASAIPLDFKSRNLLEFAAYHFSEVFEHFIGHFGVTHRVLYVSVP